jgi:hypothetical protein
MLTKTEVETNLPEIAKSPVLQAAIDGLDVTLHEELERYRHWRTHGKSLSLWQTPSFYPQEPSLASDDQRDDTKTVLEQSPDADQPPASASQSALLPSTPPEDSEEILQEWVSDYRQEIATPIQTPAPPPEAQEQTPPSADTESPTAKTSEPNHTEDSSPAEEDFSIGLAGVISLVLIVLSGSAIALLLLDPFGWFRSKPTAPPSPSPSALNIPQPDPSPIIDRQLLPTAPAKPSAPKLASPPPPTPQVVAVTVPVVPAPVPVRPARRIAPTPQAEPKKEPSPTPSPNLNTPTPEAVVSSPAPELPPVKYADPLTGQETPLPVATVTIPPPPAEEGNFVVVTDSSYRAYVQPLVQPIEQPNGKLQLGAYGDPNTAEQKAEEWRRYGVPAVVVPR